MHIYFSGIGGAGIGPLALIAHQAGYDVSGSDKQESGYLTYLREHGVSDITIGQSEDAISQVHNSKPIDWLVYSSALPRENPNHPELKFAEAQGIKCSKRDEFLNSLLNEKQLRLFAIAGTHGKTTTTAMAIWLFKQLGLPVSYNVGAKLSFGSMGEFDPTSTFFIYECDEYDRNFLSFHPRISLISGIDWDHADIYPTRDAYYQAFRDYIEQSETTVLWQADADRLGVEASDSVIVLDDNDPLLETLALPGLVNRQDAALVLHAVKALANELELPEQADITEKLQSFPGVSRRFEALKPNLYTDYAHTPKKIEGALQLAHEVAGDNVVVVYEGLHNTRQHFIKDDLVHLFDSVKKLIVVPSYLAREDESLQLLSPADIIALTSRPEKGHPAELNDELKSLIDQHLQEGDLVLCLTAGGGNSLDEWLRKKF